MSDLVQGIGQLAQQGLQIWGASQDARRQADYQRALSQARNQIGSLFETIKRTGDYRQYQDIFYNGLAAEDGTGVVPGIDAIKSEITEAWLTDPYVRTQFDRAWISLQQNAEQAVADYTYQREMVAHDVEGQQEARDTWNIGDYKTAQSAFEAIVRGNYETGVWDEARIADVRTAWQKIGIQRMSTDLEMAVQARSREAVETYIQGGLSTGLIQDADAAVALRSDYLHRIYVGEVTDQIQGMDPDTAIPWIMNGSNAPALTYEERQTLFKQANDRRDWARDEEKFQRNERDRLMLEKLNESVEAEAVAGRMPWSEALSTLQQSQVKSALTQGSWEHLYDRWTRMMLQAQEEPKIEDGTYRIADEAERSQHFERLRQWLVDEQPDPLAFEAELRKYALADENGVIRLNRTEVGLLTGMNSNRQTLESPAGTMISNIVKEYADLSEGQRNILTMNLWQQMAELQTRPDGTQRTFQELTDLMRLAAKNNAEPFKMQRINDAGTRIESLTGRNVFGIVGEWLGLPVGRQEAEERSLETLQESRGMVGTVDKSGMAQALRSGIMDEDTLTDIFLRGRIEGTLDENEKTIIANNVQAARMAINHAKAYQQFTGQKPQPGTGQNVNDMVVLADGTVAFHSPLDTLVQLRYDPQTKDEQWYEFHVSSNPQTGQRSESWVRSDALNQSNTAGGKPGLEPGEQPDRQSTTPAPPETIARPVSGTADERLAWIAPETQPKPQQTGLIEKAYLTKVEEALNNDPSIFQKADLERLQGKLNAGQTLNSFERDLLLEIFKSLGVSMFEE